MRRLSKSISELRVHYDVVVIGSGYGGGVAASRLARCGKNVCVLERGKEFPVGSFPDRLLEAQEELQVSRKDLRFGSELGLYDLRMGEDIHVFQGCGLGGTSLINANVSLAPDPRVWDNPAWPQELIEDDAREEGYARAERMLHPVPYPNTVPLKKYEALQKAANEMGEKAVCPPINVTFEERQNNANVVQPACTLCGDCCSGCNVGAKNTVQMTYLPDAAEHGADIFTECKVSYVRKEGSKWRVFFSLMGHERDKFGAPDQSICGDIIILAAGTLGSTEILLRSKEKGLAISDQLGQKFTGNGDVLAFGYNNDQRINGIGVGEPPQVDAEPVGPCITGMIDLRETKELDAGMVVEEGSLPSGLSPVIPGLLAGGAAIFGEDTDFGFSDGVGERARTLQSLFFGSYKGAANRTQTFLVMSHDDGAGQMSLQDDNLTVNWPDVAKQKNFSAVDDVLRRATSATGGTYIRNPLSETYLGENMITVHPLGGCAIGNSRKEGVVNHKSQVFNSESEEADTAVHKGLYVCDGSVMPAPLGVNPLLTITALAERAMIHIARDYGWQFNDAPKVKGTIRYADPKREGQDEPVGIEFTERMSGYLHLRDAGEDLPSDYEAAEASGKAKDTEFSFTATVLVSDIDKFSEDDRHRGSIIGSVICPALSAEPLDITEGRFNLMQKDEGQVQTRRFDYVLPLSARSGEEYCMKGYKIVRDDPGIDMWDDTTTLYIDLYKGRDGQLGHKGKGILHIAPEDFRTQLSAMKAINGQTSEQRIEAISKFGLVFAGSLHDIYGGIFAPAMRYNPSRARKKRDLRVSNPVVHSLPTQDGKTLRLTRYQGGDKGPVLLTHGLGVSSLIFTIDTIETNLVEYLYTAGYDVWLLDYRASIDLPYRNKLWTADDVAAMDYPAAVQAVRHLTGKSDIQVFAHCFGSTTFFMSMLSGLQGVRSAVVSQIAMDVIVPFWPQRMLAYLRGPSLFEFGGINVVNARATTLDGRWEKMFDGLLRIFSVQKSPGATSNRITALYGPLYELDQLNRRTFEYGLPEMFGEANIAAFKQLALIARRKHLVDHEGNDVYMPHEKRLAIPMLFIHGAQNKCFDPLSTELTYNRLTAANGPELYDRHVIPDYGHIDCVFGKNAAADVYPHILRHLEKTATA